MIKPLITCEITPDYRDYKASSSLGVLIKKTVSNEFFR